MTPRDDELLYELLPQEFEEAYQQSTTGDLNFVRYCVEATQYIDGAGDKQRDMVAALRLFKRGDHQVHVDHFPGQEDM